jgi:tetratricopeptide (TPR) repeat protein
MTETMTTTTTTNRVEELRQEALACVREHDHERALTLYDDAMALARDEETRDLITINKADALIALERTGPEVQQLARILMRRRNPRHVCLAAYALQYKNRVEQDFKRALFYGQLALQAAEELHDLAYKRAVLVDLGNVYEMDSEITKAIECFESALLLIPADEETHKRSRGYTLENLGYCRLLNSEIPQGIALILEALPFLDDEVGRSEAYIDLCYGYLESEDLDQALFYGKAGLRLAVEDRQIRNAHYLLGEVACKLGDSETADYHFDQLARFYPEFKNLKSLLFAIDLRAMVNLKL